MKKLKTHYIILILTGSYFMFNGCIDRKPEAPAQHIENNYQFWQLYAIDLQNEGYSLEASEHIAKVDYSIIPIDEEYTALIED